MSYQEALLNYERSCIIQQENQSFREAIQTAQILEMEGVKRLEKALKAPPGSGAKEDYRMACMKLAELTGQSIEDAHSQITRAMKRINKDTRPRDKSGQLISVCKTCILEAEGRCKSSCFFSKMTEQVLDRKGE